MNDTQFTLDLVARMLKDYKYVLCYLSSEPEPNERDYLGNIIKVEDDLSHAEYSKWKYAKPIDRATGKPIKDYQNGQIIVQLIGVE